MGNPDPFFTTLTVKVDPRESAKTLAMDHYYRRHGVDSWNNKRSEFLMRSLKCTRHELAAMFCVPFNDMDRYWGRDKYPGPVALHLTMLETWIRNPRKPLFPAITIATKE